MTGPNAPHHVNELLDLYLHGDTDKAERLLEEYVGRNPHDVPAQLLLGLVGSAAPHGATVLPALLEELSKVQSFADGLERLGDRLASQDDLSSAAETSYKLAASIDGLDSENREPWGGPFNGQENRRRLFDAIINNLDVCAIIETGAFRGSTTEYMAQAAKLPVLSCEINPRYFHFSQKRLSSYSNVTLALEDSRSFLKTVVSHDRMREHRVFFYLDAHWSDDLSLREEIDIVLESAPDPIIMIDDFAVPGDPGYQFDDYGPGKVLRFEYLTFLAERDLCYFYPQLSANKETGRKRGCIVICRSPTSDALAAKVDGLFRLTWSQAMLTDSLNISQTQDKRIAILMEGRQEQAAQIAKLEKQCYLELKKAEMLIEERDKLIPILVEGREKQAALIAKIQKQYSEENEVLKSQIRKLVKSRWHKVGRRLGLVKPADLKR